MLVLVAPAGVIDEQVYRAVHFAARLGGECALSPKLGEKLVAPTLHQLREPIKDLTAQIAGTSGPVVERGARLDHSFAEILAAATAHVGDRAALGVAERIAATRLAARERAADELLVRLENRDALSRHGFAPAERTA